MLLHLIQAQKPQNIINISFIKCRFRNLSLFYPIFFMVALSKLRCGKVEKAEKLEGQYCENNIQNSEEHIIPTRIMRSIIKSQTTGVFPKVCLFCNQARKRVKGKEQVLSSAESKNFEQNIRNYIE